jgi:hypothetical protein
LEGDLMAAPSAYEFFSKAVALQLRRAKGFWLGVVQGDAASAAEAEQVAAVVAERANVPFDVMRADDVSGLIATARELVQPATNTRPIWVDWSGVGTTVSYREGDQESKAAFDAVLPAINEFRERVRRCRPGGVVLALPTWAGALEQMTDLFVEGAADGSTVRDAASAPRTKPKNTGVTAGSR